MEHLNTIQRAQRRTRIWPGLLAVFPLLQRLDIVICGSDAATDPIRYRHHHHLSHTNTCPSPWRWGFGGSDQQTGAKRGDPAIKEWRGKGMVSAG